jgi:Fe-S cluster biosynthesis and repair protein YggX
VVYDENDDDDRNDFRVVMGKVVRRIYLRIACVAWPACIHLQLSSLDRAKLTNFLRILKPTRDLKSLSNAENIVETYEKKNNNTKS